MLSSTAGGSPLSVCPVCFRENDPVAGRCPSCGGPRAGAPGQPALEEETPAGRPLGGVALARAAPLSQQANLPRPASAHPASGPRLILKGPGSEVTEYPLGRSSVLGRSATASVRLADREVSRKHSQIDREGDDYVLRDLGSSNGTFLNGKRILGPAKLADGDEVLIGTSKMEFRLTSGPARPKNAEIVHTGKPGELEGIVARTSAKATFLPVEQVQDMSQLKRDYERLRVGHEFSTYVRLERDLNELLRRILEIAFDLIPCDNGVILLRDPHSQELVIQSMRQRKPGQGKVLVSDTLLAQVQLTKEGVQIGRAHV